MATLPAPFLPSHVNIVEVGPRDGLQNEKSVDTSHKVNLINQLTTAGLTHIESGAFVAAKRIPQMADSTSVFQQITKKENVTYSALTPNLQGFEAALSVGADEVAVFTSCSESFTQRNIHCSIEESIQRFIPVIEAAHQHNIRVRGYLSCIVDCPYEGKTKPEQVSAISDALIELGCYQVSLGDTIGTGTPLRIARVLEAVLNNVPTSKLAVHFHDTYGQSLANLYQALLMGIETIDSSVAGLGGCPYADGASGNVATEDVLYLCHELGIATGVDLESVARTGWTICNALNKEPASKVSLALRAKQGQR